MSCVIVGDGPERQNLEELANRLGVQGSVRFTGFLPEDPYGLMKSSRLFVFPSRREGFGLVVLEAAACGLPVIAVEAENNAAASLVRNGQFGMVCLDEPFQIAEAIVRLLDDERLRLELTERGIQWSKAYEWATVAHKTEDTFLRLGRNG